GFELGSFELDGEGEGDGDDGEAGVWTPEPESGAEPDSGVSEDYAGAGSAGMTAGEWFGGDEPSEREGDTWSAASAADRFGEGSAGDFALAASAGADRFDADAADEPGETDPPAGTGLAGSAVSTSPSLFGPQSVVEAVQVLAGYPDAVIIAGGTAVMPDIAAGRRHPNAIVTLHRCAELRGWSPGPGEVLLHAGLTLTEMQRQELRAQVPALAQAARTIGAPHIRAAATLGGNLIVGPVSADLPVVLAALGAFVLVASAGGVREVSVFEFYDRDGVPQIAPGELLIGARVPVVRGMQGFMKIGVRGGTSRAILSTTLAVDPARRSATCVVGAMAQAALPQGVGLGGLPALLRADHADRWLADQVDWDAGAIPDPAVYETFGRLVAESLVYGDGAGTLGGGGDPYRRKAAEICARRLLLRALPPLGWLDQVRELQQRADFQRAKQRVERAEQAKNQDSEGGF
ncbi:MAG: FAD binding domain-containing protein, partial [Catenulisporales bacterium]|nr:FAD binding domain-containing protein [Catenulisporales bacterium]